MNEEMFKNIIKLKIVTAHTIIQRLPGFTGKYMRKFEESFVNSVVEAAKEWETHSFQENKSRDLKQISID